MLSKENGCDGRAFAYATEALNRSLLLHDSSNALLRRFPVVSEPVLVRVLVRCSAHARKHDSLAGACQRILRDQSPGPRLAWLVAETLAKEEPARTAGKVGSSVWRAERQPLDLRVGPALMKQGLDLELTIRVHAVEKHEPQRAGLAVSFGCCARLTKLQRGEWLARDWLYSGCA